jgi:hypothetical protein
MQPNKTLFFGIIILAIVIVIAMFAAFFLIGDSLDVSNLQQPVSIQVVTASSIKPWVEQAAQRFNADNATVQVEIVEANNLIPESQFRSSDPQMEPPAAWLAEAGFVLKMANNSDLQFDDFQSVAKSSLAWGAFNSRREVFTQTYGGLNWLAIHERAVEPDSSLKLVIASPINSAEGVGALISAAAAHLKVQSLSEAEIRQAEPWLTETFGESARSSLTLGPRPAEAFATRGASIGDAGILSLASWHGAGLQNRTDFSITPAEPNVILDYPFAIWAGSQATPEGQAAAAAFRDFLLSEAQQNALADFYFERAESSIPGVTADGAAALTLYRWAGLELTP